MLTCKQNAILVFYSPYLYFITHDNSSRIETITLAPYPRSSNIRSSCGSLLFLSNCNGGINGKKNNQHEIKLFLKNANPYHKASELHYITNYQKLTQYFTFPYIESLVSITEPFTTRSTDPKLLSLGVLDSGGLTGSPNMLTSGGACKNQGTEKHKNNYQLQVVS